MLRYLGIMWNDTSPQQRETAQFVLSRLKKSPSTWHPRFAGPGMQVFCTGSDRELAREYLLPGNSGVVIGTIFSRSRDIHSPAANEPLNLGTAHVTALLGEGGSWLIENAWGDYVAFGYHPEEQKKWVLKDPTGSLPCLRTVYRDVTIFFSRISDCMDLQLQRFTVNETFLQAHVAAAAPLQELSALNEVQAVQRGECIEYKRGNGPYGVRKLLWSPLNFTHSEDLIEDPELAARAMHNTIQATTSSWAHVHPSLLLRLSGGLDSSIIAGCLRNAPDKSRFVAYTYFSPVGRSDERPWARQAAALSGCEHIEYSVTPAGMDLRLGLQMAPSPEPSPLLAFMQRTTVEQPIASACGATAVFNGEGGDSGFCSDSIRYAVPEYLRNRGLTPGVFRLAGQVALLVEKSSWSVLTQALRVHFGKVEQPAPRERMLAASRLVNPEVQEKCQTAVRATHPWFQDVPHTPWDTVRRLGTLIVMPDYYNIAAASDAAVPEIISPLYAQPVIELLLRIPIYTHFHGGHDRGLARKAFVGDVPDPILRRLWKDRVPGFHSEMIERQRDFLKETLLEGSLARSGLLVRAKLEEALASGPNKSNVYPGEVFRHLDTELWARHWLQSSRHQAVA